MAHLLIVLSAVLASSPYYQSEPSLVLNALQSQASDLSECQPKGDGTLKLALHISSDGIPVSITASEADAPVCLETIILGWKFPEHKEDIAILHIVLSSRENRYYLLPGSHIEKTDIGQRYWMDKPILSTDVSAENAEASESQTAEQTPPGERKP